MTTPTPPKAIATITIPPGREAEVLLRRPLCDEANLHLDGPAALERIVIVKGADIQGPNLRVVLANLSRSPQTVSVRLEPKRP
jgi:hypothetical protein